MSYCHFEVGQHVVCVQNQSPMREALDDYHRAQGKSSPQWPEVGKVYTVRRVAMNVPATKALVVLVEISNPEVIFLGRSRNVNFPHDWFRPLPKLKVEDFMTADAPVDGVGELVT